jgi:hypothetical protein
MLDTEYEQLSIKIQIRRNYVLHLSNIDNKIISGF